LRFLAIRSAEFEKVTGNPPPVGRLERVTIPEKLGWGQWVFSTPYTDVIDRVYVKFRTAIVHVTFEKVKKHRVVFVMRPAPEAIDAHKNRFRATAVKIFPTLRGICGAGGTRFSQSLFVIESKLSLRIFRNDFPS